MNQEMKFMNRIYLLLLLFCCRPVHAEETTGYIGVVLQEAVGAGETLTSAGHLTMIATNLCADGIRRIRRCDDREPRGVVIGRYSRIASNLDIDWMVLPLNIALFGAPNYDDAPLLSTPEINRALQLQYWRKMLQEEIPTLSDDEYDRIHKAKSTITAGKVISDVLIIGLISKLMDRKEAAEQSVAISNPENGDWIPAGRWMESIGIRGHRGSVAFLVESSQTQEERMLTYLDSLPNDQSKFNDLHANCADFSRDVLSEVFTDPPIKFQSKLTNPADVFGLVTSPITISKGLLKYAQKQKKNLQVVFLPEDAGTNAPTSTPRTLAHGILVPDTSRGKVAFLLKLIITKLNWMIPASAITADLISQPMNINKEIHAYPESIDQLRLNHSDEDDSLPTLQEKRLDQILTFGTENCWNSARQEFKEIAKTSNDKELDTAVPGWIAIQSLSKHGLEAFYDEQNQLRVRLGNETSGITRNNILDYRNDSNLSPALALKLAAATLHYDLASSSLDRRQVSEFDKDREIFKKIALDNGLNIDGNAPSLAECSLAELERNPKAKDSLEHAMSFIGTVARVPKSIQNLFELPSD